MLLFIMTVQSGQLLGNRVSIHPMLLFIKFTVYAIHWEKLFQYIPCYSLSNHRHIHDGLLHVSIHPMLLFIYYLSNDRAMFISFQYIPCYSLSNYTKGNNRWEKVSIHPMLLFIMFCLWTYCGYLVSIHPMLLFIDKRSGNGSDTGRVSIHPMLLFIKHYCWVSVIHLGVSIHPMLLFITTAPHQAVAVASFNTSHVTLYLSKCSSYRYNVLFQYIPCYSLSDCSAWVPAVLWSFNTSHVTLYLKYSFISFSRSLRFNTSHVTLYRWPKRNFFCST